MRLGWQVYRDQKDADDIAFRRRQVELAKRRLLAAAERDRAAQRQPVFVASEGVFSAGGADTTRDIQQQAKGQERDVETV